MELRGASVKSILRAESLCSAALLNAVQSNRKSKADYINEMSSLAALLAHNRFPFSCTHSHSKTCRSARAPHHCDFDEDEASCNPRSLMFLF